MKKSLLLLFMSVAFLACSKSDDNTPPVKLSNLKEMSSFKIKVGDKGYEAEIKDGFIKAVLPSAADLTKLSPEIKVSEKAKVSPGSSVVQDFTKTVEYTVTAEDKSTKVYKAFITKTSSQNLIESFAFTNLPEGESSLVWKDKNPLDMDTLIYKVPSATNIKALTSKITVSAKATVDPASGSTLDYSKPVKYTVKAEDGTKKEYLVMVDNTLAKVKINAINRDDYRGKKPGEIISFTTNVLPSVKEEVKVQLFGTNNPTKGLDLVVESIDVKSNKVNVVLPKDYQNDQYYFKVYIASNNSAVGNSFVLDGGITYFIHIADVRNQSTKNYVPCTALLMPGEIFKANMNLERAKFNSYKFYLRKDGKDIPLQNAKLDSSLEQVKFVMPNVPSTPVSSGRGYELVVKKDGNQESVHRLVNTKGSEIAVTVGGAPVIKALSKNKVKAGEVIQVIGDNLFFSYSEGDSSILNEESKITLKLNGNTYVKPLKYSEGRYSFDTKDMQPGTFTVTVMNNIKTFGASTQNTVLVIEDDSAPITLKVNSAEIFSEKNKFTPKEIFISFNESIANVNIVKVVVDANRPDIAIENFITYPSTMTTGKLPDDKYKEYYANPSKYKGYVVVEVKGKEYKLPFTLVHGAD